MLETMKAKKGLTGFRKASRNFIANYSVGSVAWTKRIF